MGERGGGFHDDSKLTVVQLSHSQAIIVKIGVKFGQIISVYKEWDWLTLMNVASIARR